VKIRASAPGKVVVLGEYAVLSGAQALVLAVDYRAWAEIEPSSNGRCRLETRFPDPATVEVPAGAATGVALVDAVMHESACAPRWPWRATLDSSAFYARTSAGRGVKMGLGSSAAALVAWTAAWCRAAGADVPDLAELVRLHRRFQGGAGSGIDVAASCCGGATRYGLDDEFVPRFGSVRLPNSVGFAGIFAGSAASTPDLVSRYHRWVVGQPTASAVLLRRLGDIAQQGCLAAASQDGEAFLRAIDDYGRGLEALGEAMGAPIVTAEHREIETLARRVGVAYKVSGAGGGDLGLAAAVDVDRLRDFVAEAEQAGFRSVPLAIAEHGVVVEEPSE
jgi:phosphomevalonate kinase